jgi:hypothetical protein
MHLPRMCRIATVLVVSSLAGQASAQTEERTAADLLPMTTLLYAELTDPSALVTQLIEHPLRERLLQLDVYQQLLTDPKLAQFQAQRQGIEALLGYRWQEMMEILAADGVVVAFDPRTEGACLLTRSGDPQALQKLATSLLNLARQDARNKDLPDPVEETEYRGVSVYLAGEGGLAVHDGWLVAVNKKPLGQQILDALLDGPRESLASQSSFLEARQNLPPDGIAWACVNLNMLREAVPQHKAFSGKADDPAGELILGGVLDALTHAPWLASSLILDEGGLDLHFKMPHRAEWISQEREHFFGPQGEGTAPVALDVPDALFALTAYRNASLMWLRAGDLFNDKVNDNFAQAENTLTTLFSGRDFAEEVLGELSPQLQILAARQQFEVSRPIPDIKLPAFALVAEMKNPAETTQSFRQIFQSLIGFLNVVGAQNAQPQLQLSSEQLDGGEVVAATFLPDTVVPVEQQTAINFNFSPSIAFAGSRLILSSTTDLARKLVQAAPLAAAEDADRTNSQLTVHSATLHGVLDDNRTHLIAQNMLKEGNSREEAQREIQTLLDLLTLIEDASVALNAQQSALDLSFRLQFRQQR